MMSQSQAHYWMRLLVSESGPAFTARRRRTRRSAPIRKVPYGRASAISTHVSTWKDSFPQSATGRPAAPARDNESGRRTAKPFLLICDLICNIAQSASYGVSVKLETNLLGTYEFRLEFDTATGDTPRCFSEIGRTLMRLGWAVLKTHGSRAHEWRCARCVA